MNSKTTFQTTLNMFNDNLASKPIQYQKSLYNKDFMDFNLKCLTENSLVYCDPPYLITTGSYNDGNRGFKNWTKKEEKDLLKLLSRLNKNNIKFALSNVTIHDGKRNEILINWIEENGYSTISIESDYTNSNYQKKNKNNKENKEVLIINY